jgi:hypothetical protein
MVSGLNIKLVTFRLLRIAAVILYTLPSSSFSNLFNPGVRENLISQLMNLEEFALDSYIFLTQKIP